METTKNFLISLTQSPILTRQLHRLTLGLTLLLFIVTILTPTFTLVPIYLATETFSSQSSPTWWTSTFLKAYAQYLNDLASQEIGEMTYVFCCAQTSYYDFSSKDASIGVGPAPVYSIVVSGSNISVNKQRGNSQGLIITNTSINRTSYTSNVAAPIVPEATPNQNLTIEKLIERFWWPPIDAVRLVYLLLCAGAVLLGAFSIGLGTWQRKKACRMLETNLL